MGLKKITEESVDCIKVLVIGPAGIGKTSLLRTIPEDEKAFVISAEGGLLCVRDLVKSGRIEGYEIFSLTDFREAYSLLVENKKNYKWVFIDSLTEISSRCVEHMQAKYPGKADGFNMWGDYNKTMTTLIKAFRDLSDISVVFTCLDSREKDELNRFYYAPSISGSQLKEKLTSYFDEVLYMALRPGEDGAEKRVFITQPFERFPAKDRSGCLDLTETPSMSTIKNKILS